MLVNLKIYFQKLNAWEIAYTKGEVMKRYGNLYQIICSKENLRLAHQNARKGKGWYKEVKMVDSDVDHYINLLHDMLVNKTYQTSEYVTFIKRDSNKDRVIYKLPYFPDRICQWAIIQVIEPILIKNLIQNTYSAIPGRGIHKALDDVKKAIQKDPTGMAYCLKLDVKKYYPSIDHAVLKGKFRRMFKDPDLLWLLDEIIDSTPGNAGIPIGNYVSQYCGNMSLSGFDHWIKEEKHIRHYFRYMDDICIFSKCKEELHKLRKEIDKYFEMNLHLTIKSNWQVFPTFTRGLDFVGYRIFRNFVLLRKSTCKQFKKKMTHIIKKINRGMEMNFSEWCSINSYRGWLLHCDSFRLSEKYLYPLQLPAEQYYLNRVKRKVAKT